MEKFSDIYKRAVERKGSEKMLKLLLEKPLSTKQLVTLSDDDWLEEFTRKVFQSGFYWSVINSKWAGFREVFWDFSVEKLLMMPPDMLEQKASDERIVRNYKKVKTITDNAYMIHEVAEQHGSFSQFIANWPSEDIIGDEEVTFTPTTPTTCERASLSASFLPESKLSESLAVPTK